MKGLDEDRGIKDPGGFRFMATLQASIISRMEITCMKMLRNMLFHYLQNTVLYLSSVPFLLHPGVNYILRSQSSESLFLEVDDEIPEDRD